MLAFNVLDMTCGHCVGSVTKAVHQVDPAAGVQIDLVQHLVQVETKANTGQIEAAIRDAGFTPVPVTA